MAAGLKCPEKSARRPRDAASQEFGSPATASKLRGLGFKVLGFI